jgi:uncharacterized protein
MARRWPRGCLLRAENRTRGTIVASRMELADSLWTRFLGLMGRGSLPEGGGMLITDTSSIHMLFMRMALDCVFTGKPDASGAVPVMGLRRGLPAWSGIVWGVRGGRDVLELPVGAIDASGTQVGDLLSISEA